MAATDDEEPVQTLPRTVPTKCSAEEVAAQGPRTEVLMIRIPSVPCTSSKLAVDLGSRSPMRNWSAWPARS